MPNWAIIRRSLMTDFVRNFLCFDDFWPNAASAKSSHQEFADGLFLVISIMEGVMHTKKTGSDLQLIANHPVFKFEASFFQSLFVLLLLDRIILCIRYWLTPLV